MGIADVTEELPYPFDIPEGYLDGATIGPAIEAGEPGEWQDDVLWHVTRTTGQAVTVVYANTVPDAYVAFTGHLSWAMVTEDDDPIAYPSLAREGATYLGELRGRDYDRFQDLDVGADD